MNKNGDEDKENFENGNLRIFQETIKIKKHRGRLSSTLKKYKVNLRNDHSKKGRGKRRRKTGYNEEEDDEDGKGNQNK